MLDAPGAGGTVRWPDSAAENLEDPNCVLHTADCSEEVEMSHLSSPVNDKVYFKNLKIKTAFNT